jgi:hypothetical protein
VGLRLRRVVGESAGGVGDADAASSKLSAVTIVSGISRIQVVLGTSRRWLTIQRSWFRYRYAYAVDPTLVRFSTKGRRPNCLAMLNERQSEASSDFSVSALLDKFYEVRVHFKSRGPGGLRRPKDPQAQ